MAKKSVQTLLQKVFGEPLGSWTSALKIMDVHTPNHGRPHQKMYFHVAPLMGRNLFQDRKGTPKNFCDKDFAELLGELSGAICLKPLVLLGSALELLRKFFGTVRAIFWLSGSFLALDYCQKNPRVRKILSAILGQEMAAPILWAPGKMRSFGVFPQEKPMSIKIPPFRGGGYFGFWGGECRFYFYGREDFPDIDLRLRNVCAKSGRKMHVYRFPKVFFRFPTSASREATPARGRAKGLKTPTCRCLLFTFCPHRS